MPPRVAPASTTRVDWRVALCTAAALTGFASNSLLTRAGVGSGAIDPASFTTVRLTTGALTLWLLLRWRSPDAVPASGWRAPMALAAYMVAFSFAYLRVGASAGALLLFGSVQITMMGWSLSRGERPGLLGWSGLLLAIGGLVWLVAPGLTAPDPVGAAAMAGAGVAWGGYSLIGRGVADPLAVTTSAFVRATPIAVAMSVALWGRAHGSARGLVLAAVSGSLASGLGYTLWYTALPSLAAWRAALLQLFVPVMTAVGAALLLGEGVTVRLAGATALVLAGVVLPMLRRGR
jgi:drug/metabolite transporter (DMT)-like permease